jgi:DNA replication initiation complex subunit (GINS family)
MYNELYAAWRREIEEAPLGGLPPDFYVRIADYLRHIIEENKVLDKKSVKVNLLNHEAQNAKWMLKDLLRARYKKLVKTITQSHKLPSNLLTVEEAKMCESFVAFTDAYQKFAKDLMQGQTIKLDIKVDVKVEPEVSHKREEAEVSRKRVVLRFTKNIPAIIGADMKLYGPFVAEDVASLPAENAKMLVKQGLAISVEVS